MGSNKFLCERTHGASRICFSKISRIYFFPLFLSLFLSSLCRGPFRKKHLIQLGRTSRKKGHLGSDLENHLQMHEVTETDFSEVNVERQEGPRLLGKC